MALMASLLHKRYNLCYNISIMSEHPSPYRYIHSNLSSTFLAPQPVDTRIESIRNHVGKNIPNMLDTILLMSGGVQTETASNSERGAVPLFPALAETRRLAQSPDSRGYDTVLASLTDHAYLPASHVRTHTEDGMISEFSLVFTNPLSKDGESYELQGSLTTGDDEPEFEEDFYLTETNKHGNIDTPLKLDSGIALSIVQAACMQHGSDNIPTALTDKLSYLLEKSAQKTIRTVGEYLVSQDETILQAHRSEFVTRKLGKDAIRLLSYSARIQRAAPQPADGVDVVSALNLSYDSTARPKYNAMYDLVVNDPHQVMPREARTAYFEERFMLYRSRPELFFEELSGLLDRATIL